MKYTYKSLQTLCQFRDDQICILNESVLCSRQTEIMLLLSIVGHFTTHKSRFELARIYGREVSVFYVFNLWPDKLV